MSLGEIPSVCDVALQYAALGFRVIPVKPDKKPAIDDWTNKATLQPDTIRQWWQQFPNANVGICPDPDFCILDIDVKNGGLEKLQQLEAEHGKLPDAVRSLTGGGGRHYYFRVDPTRQLARKPFGKEVGIELVHFGHQAVEWPSKHQSGKHYQWVKAINLAAKQDWPWAPEWFYKPIQQARQEPPKEEGIFRDRPYYNGSTDRFEAYCLAALANQRNELANVISGNRNEALNIAALKLGHLAHYGFFTAAKVHDELKFSCELNGLIADDGPHSFEATFASGWKKGISEPKEIPDRPFEEEVKRQQEEAQPSDSQNDSPDEFVNYLVDDQFCANIPPRQWLYGRKVIRGFCTLLVSPGGVGKTAFTVGLALACQQGKPLLKDKPHKPMNVWGIWLEEPKEELQRRITAAKMHYRPGIADPQPRELRVTGRNQSVLLAKPIGKDGFILTPDVEKLENQIRRQKSEIVIIDPFIKTHEIDENNNSLIEKVVTIFNRIAERTNCAIFLVHHTRKGAIAGDAESSRGGGAIVGNVRAAFTLAPMSPEDAKSMNVSADERRFLIRLDDAKANMAPKGMDAEWMKLLSQDLGNGTPEYPAGDNVQVISAWQPPEAAGGLSVAIANEILNILDAGMPQGDGMASEPYSNSQSTDRWAGHVIMQVMAEYGHEKSEEQAAAILKLWMTSEPPLLALEEYRSERQRKMKKGLFVNNSNRPGEH